MTAESKTISLKAQAKIGSVAGIKKGWHSFVWMCEIVIPVSFLVAALQWTGWLDKIDFLLAPLMNLVNLPPEAALPIISGILINLYATVAIITVVPFTMAQTTLIAVFNLIAHNLIMEGLVQHRSGFNVVKATIVRIVAAIVGVLIVSLFFSGTGQSVSLSALPTHTPILQALETWGISLAKLVLKIFLIIMGIMIVLESLKSLGWIEYLLRVFRPIMRILGLPARTATMWVASIIFGIFYGGAVVIEEAKNGDIPKEDLERFHVFTGINHAMIEDPALFVVLGIGAIWLWIPRLVMGITVLQGYRVFKYVQGKLTQPKRVTA